MKQQIFTVATNTRLTDTVYEMKLAGRADVRCGQFVNIKLDGFFLRRPISVCDTDEAGLTLVYKVVGGGTAAMSRLRCGDTLDLLTGLGNGYDTAKSGPWPLLIGGGVGVPPLYLLCKTLLKEGKKPTVIIGFNTLSEVFYERQFKELGVHVHITTADGSYGLKGFVTDAMRAQRYTFFYACGPEPMFRAIDRMAETGGQYSFEERMGCGFGACMGCSCKTLTGHKRICKEGPVLDREEIIWN